MKAAKVTVSDARGVQHTVEVTADSLFEAAALALAALKADEWTEPVGPGTRLEVQVQHPVVVHKLTVKQLERWLNRAMPSPNETLKKKRLRELLSSGLSTGRPAIGR